MAETTTQRKRVTPQDIKKREIKLDIVEQKKAPGVPIWYLAPVVLPVALWIFSPAHAGIWLALTATTLCGGFAGLVFAEQQRDDLVVDREIVFSFIRNLLAGVALAIWMLYFAGFR